MTHVSLFTGIGGLDLAAEWAGFKTILQVEMDDYANKVLEKHWPDVPRVRDIRDVTRDSIIGPVTVISGGFPCQPFSTAARGRNNAEDLWPEMYRVISEVIPKYVISENVQRFPIARAAGQLGSRGYRNCIFRISSSSVGAIHNRRRWFLLSYTDTDGKSIKLLHEKVASIRILPRLDEWQQPPRDLGMDDGISYRMDRLKCLGNAVVPQQAYPIFKAIAEVELDKKRA